MIVSRGIAILTLSSSLLFESTWILGQLLHRISRSHWNDKIKSSFSLSKSSNWFYIFFYISLPTFVKWYNFNVPISCFYRRISGIPRISKWKTTQSLTSLKLKYCAVFCSQPYCTWVMSSTWITKMNGKTMPIYLH